MPLRFLRAAAWAALAYLVAAGLAYVGILRLSSNPHDRPMEAAMTAIFVIGPAAAALVLLLGLTRWRNR